MEPYQLWLVLGSSITIITGGIGWLMSKLSRAEDRIHELEVVVAVLKAIAEERKH